MFKKIRTQLLVVLIAFILVTLVASLTLFNYFEKSKDSLSGITLKAEKIHLLLQQDINISHAFIENETINPAFFSTGRSRLLLLHDSIWQLIDNELDQLYRLQYKYNFGLDDSLVKIKSEFMMYRFYTDEISKKLLVRGFKDYGVEGRMRVYAHQLENHQDDIGLIDILQLRRHEKDFIIRQEDAYIAKHQELIRQVKERMESDKKLSPERRQDIIKTIGNYATEFENLIMSEKMLGLKSNKGLKHQIDEASEQITSGLASIVDFSAKKEASAISNIRITYLVTGAFFILFAVAAALFISGYISRSTRALQKEINEFVNSGFTLRSTLQVKSRANEIAQLQHNFIVMEQHIVDQMGALKKTNQDLETLFYVTSHDLRHPLIKIREMSEEALATVNDPAAISILQRMRASWEQIIALVDELGLITKVKHSPIQAEPVELKPLLRSVYSEFKEMPGFDDIIFSLDIRSKRQLHSSPTLLRTAFRNLFENSVKYATKRNSFSFIKVLVADQNEQMLRIEISDNGIGIPKEFHDRIFTMFFRGTDQAQGAGIGLYVAQCAVEKLNGAIGVESDGNTGTTFTLLIPFMPEEMTTKKKNFLEGSNAKALVG